jgi:predicted secreted protein
MTTRAQILFRDNDMVLEVDELRDRVAGTFQNAAAVAVTLKDSASMNVTGATWPLSLAYVPSSNGLYRVTLPNGLSLVQDATYTAHLTANAGLGLVATWEIPCVCRLRR